jgi:hypothetical protein
MQITLFILLFLFFLFIIHAVTKKKYLLSNGELILIFTCKVMMSCLYGYIFLEYYGGDDTWRLNDLSIYEHTKLVQNTAQFFTDLNPLDPLQRNESLGTGFHFLLLDYEYWMITKPLAVFNFVSGGNYYINVIFFSFITFWGPYWLFSLMNRVFPGKRMNLLFIIFFFPPTLFWLSGLRADGMLLLFFSLMLLHFYRWVNSPKKRYFAWIVIGLSGVLIYRDAVVMLLAPALLSWFLTARYGTKPFLTYVAVYGICAIIFFLSALLPDSDGLAGLVASRQHEYLALEGNTRYGLDSLHANVGSYLKVLPQAANNTFLRPYIWEASGMLQLVTAAGILFFWLLLAVAMVRKEKPWYTFFSNPLFIFLVIFPACYYLFIGFTVPFPGAIVRYKSIPELMLLSVLVLNVRIGKKELIKD